MPEQKAAAGRIRLGITGANAERAWALAAHLPSVSQMPEAIAVTAVSARTTELAEKARVVFGAGQAFGNSLELVRSPDVDLVAVTVKVPEHRPIVLAALAAGKDIYCEWPLGRDLAEAREMAAAVPAGAHVMIGLQGLSAPAVRHAQHLIAQGAIGALRVMRVHSPSVGWGEEVPPVYAYLQEKRNGATLETVATGHTLAIIDALAGPYVEVDARCSTLRKQVRLSGTDEMVERTCADHVMVLGLHDSGCVSTLEVIGGVAKGEFTLVVEGEKGWIKLSGGDRGARPCDSQSGPLILETSFAGIIDLPQTFPATTGAAINVSESYGRLVQDIASNSFTVPDFDTAVRLHDLIDAIDRASLSGRQKITP